jgi:cytoskeleton protein RodZ
MPDDSIRDFGAYLRQARERQGVSLREIATATKISVPALEALERNDISRLPGGIFTRSFVRSYAREVGLDADDTVQRFLDRFPGEALQSEEQPTEPRVDRRLIDEEPSSRTGWRAFGWALPLLLVVAYFGFGGRLPFWQDQNDASARAARQAAEQAPPAPAWPAPNVAATTVPAEVPESGPTAVGAGAESGSSPVALAPAGQATSSSGTAAPPAAPAAASASRASQQGAVVPATVPPLPEGAFRLTLAPREACWVSIRVGGKSVFAGMVQAGDRKDVQVTGEAVLTVGNAGGFAFAINGQPGRSLGEPGKVVTTRINAQNLNTFVQ